MHAVITSAAGDSQRRIDLPSPDSPQPKARTQGSRSGIQLVVRPERTRQTLVGIGSSLTQASAAALATLPANERQRVLEAAFGADAAAFSLIRTHIASCDFSTSSYTYAPDADPSLAGFSVDVDETNGHLALLRDASAVAGADFRVVASPWTAPAWMKDNGRLFQPEEHRGGTLLPEHHTTFASYITRYVEAYAARGIPIWAVTPVNEPHGNQGTWESMEMSPDQQRQLVAVLGDTLRARGHDTQILIYDQNRAGMREYADTVLSDPAAAAAALGTAVHWYDSTFRVYEDELEALHAAWPGHLILQTEGCIDNVFGKGVDRGPDAPTPWWQDDGWYWRKEATDWGWDWAENPEVDHPPYAAAFRYARDLVGCLAHWVSGWIDWNLVLDRRGGPNHVGNFCLAPILVDGDEAYFTPMFHVLSQISRHSRPGAVVVDLDRTTPEGAWSTALIDPDGTRIVHVFNETTAEHTVGVTWGDTRTQVDSPPASLLTIVLD
ncbi:MAG: hypothetical protein KTR31_33000 [Myxococcales bacterium]|nr:hypothetical protein [Myxococcales bacterium]